MKDNINKSIDIILFLIGLCLLSIRCFGGTHIPPQHPVQVLKYQQQILAAGNTMPPGQDFAHYDSIMNALNGAGMLDSIEFLNLDAVNVYQNALIPFICANGTNNNGTWNTTNARVNSMTFTSYLGWTGNGSNMEINTEWNTNADAVYTSQNSISLGVYLPINPTIGATEDYGNGGDLGHTIMFLYYTANKMYYILIGGTEQSQASSGTLGMYYLIRESSSYINFYKNGSSPSGQQSSTSSTFPNVSNFTLGGNSTDGNFSKNTYSWHYLGTIRNATKFYNIMLSAKT